MRIYMIALGCPKNEVDSEMMAELLRSAGHSFVDTPRRADVLIVNTCAFVAPARTESYATLRELAEEKRPEQRLVVAGCLAQRYGRQIHEQVPGVDGLIGTRSWPEIVTLLERLAGDGPISLLRMESNLVATTPRHTAGAHSAYVKIADGCDAACAFCAIPLIKGPQQSKPMEAVLHEVRDLVAEGINEIVLIAQDTTAYGRDLGMHHGLPLLLSEILAAAPTLDWLRILYAYPQHLSERTIEVMASNKQVCHYLDLPLQHGHPDVLRRMRRPHDLESIYRTVEMLRGAVPDIALRSSFIVGFPGETESEFEALLDFMEEVAFDKVGVFAYSAEDGTLAANLPDRVPAEMIAERHERAMLAQQAISLARNRMQVGRVLPILIEGSGEGLSVGRSYRDAPEIDGLVLMAGDLPVGQFVRARITEAQEYDLVAEPET